MSSDERLQRRVEQLFDSSQKVLDGVALKNGVIVAGNSELEEYPPSAESYLFFWGRDAAYQLRGQQILDAKKAEDRAVKLAQWIRRVPVINDEKIIVKRYAPNGALDVRYGEHYQPDQAGALIGSLDEIVVDKQDDVDSVIFTLAEGLAEHWNGQAFGPTQDLWENRETVAEHHDVFTYSLASVIHGMRRAITRARRLDGFDRYAVDNWERSVAEMSQVINSLPEDREIFLRKIYPNPYEHDPDNTLDASLEGLIYPFDVIDERVGANRMRLERTVLAIHHDLYRDGFGVYRYLSDTYDGIVRHHSAEAGAGTWPLLTFWHSIALERIGKHREARDVFYGEIEQLDTLFNEGALPDNIIPEQVFDNPEKQGRGILPFPWGHAMFVISAHELGIVKK